MSLAGAGVWLALLGIFGHLRILGDWQGDAKLPTMS